MMEERIYAGIFQTALVLPKSFWPRAEALGLERVDPSELGRFTFIARGSAAESGLATLEAWWKNTLKKAA